MSISNRHDDLAPIFQIDPNILDEQGNKVLSLVSKHFSELSGKPVKPHQKAGQLAAQFENTPPDQPQALDHILEQLQRRILPGITHWQHPKFFAYYPASSSIPAILSEIVISAIGSVGLQWSANPISTELECVVMDWLMDMLHAPLDSPFRHRSMRGGGIIQNTAGEALVVVMTAARIHKHLSQNGLQAEQLSQDDRERLYYQDSSRLVVYMSDQTHFSGPKAVRVAGMRVHTLRAERLANGNYGITAAQVRNAVEQDRALGLVPCCVQLNYGSTNTCGYDDLASFNGFAEDQDIWVHVDAAYAGPSLCLPQNKERSQTLQNIATSFNFNGSKWFLCGFDSAFLFVSDRRRLTDVFSATGDYLAASGDACAFNPEFKDWAVPLGRRFRSLRIWMVLNYFGVQGIRAFLEQAIAQADWLRSQIDQSDAFEQVAKTDLGLVCFATRDPASMDGFVNRLNQLADDGEQFLLYPSTLHGRPFIRVALGGMNTTEDDVRSLWATLRAAAQ